MQPLYESIPNDLEIYRRRSGHFMPHVHNLAEIVLCEKGTLEIGVGPELYHMEEGDIAVLFPGLIHHAQCFDGSGQASSIYLLAALSLTGPFKNQLAKMQPQNPVIPAEEVHPDVRLMMQSLFRDYGNQSLRASYRKALEDGGPKPDTSAGQSAEPGPLDASSGTIADMARVELILSRTLLCLHLVPRPEKEDGDIVYRLVKYMAGHYREPLSLDTVARALYISPYELSRLFSKTFHTNFNGYLNSLRLSSACNELRYTARSITEIWLDVGFESQRTFNRTFRTRFHCSPREWRTAPPAQEISAPETVIRSFQTQASSQAEPIP